MPVTLKKSVKITESDPVGCQKTWSVNVIDPYLVTCTFLPQVISRGGNKIVVNLRNVAYLTSPGASAHRTSKLAVLRFKGFSDVDHGPDGGLTLLCTLEGCRLI